MSDLRGLFEQLRLAGARTLLQSGNVVFRSRARSAANLERLLEVEAAKRLVVDTEFFVRTAEEWYDVVARNPFREEAARDPGHLIVVFLKDSPDAKAVQALQAAVSGPE